MYFDYAATSPMLPEALAAYVEAAGVLGNASSIHSAGQKARRLLEDSREAIAEGLGCQSIEVVLNSGGTEGTNTALKGLFWSHESNGILLPDGEHHAAVDTAQWLATAQGATIRSVPLTPEGLIETAEFERQIPGVAVATATVANNETGAINPVEVLSNISANAGVPLHLDAVAALGHIPVNFAEWRGGASGDSGLMALSVSAHKIGGPTGVGALVVSRESNPAALIHGGGAQRKLRAGTPDVAGAAAFAAAMAVTVGRLEATAARASALRDRLISGVASAIPAAVLLGPPVNRLPNNAHFLFPGALGETMLFLLDQRGIAASTGAACQAGIAEPSHVVRALGRDDRDATGVLRFTLGEQTTAAEIDQLIAKLPEVYEIATRARG